jgi:hypothetical protein
VEFLADRSCAGRRRAPLRIVMARSLDWHTLVHNLPGLAVLALAAGAGIWATRRFVAPARQIASVRLLFVFIVYYAVAGQALTSYMQDFAFAGDDPDLGLEALVRGTAEQPYVYRRLAPDIVHALSAFAARTLPERVQIKMERQSHVKRLAFPGDTSRQFRFPGDTIPTWARPPESWNRQKALDFHAAYAFEFVCFFLTLWVARAFTRSLFPEAPLFADVAPVVMLILRMYSQPWMMYDASETLLVFASALCITRMRIWAHLPIFMLAVFNKESNVLLAPVALVALYGFVPRRRWVAAGVAHLVIGGAMLAWVYHAYAHNPGGHVQNHLTENIAFWSNARNYFRFEDVFAPAIRSPVGANPLLMIPALALVAAGWAPSPSIIRRMFVTSLGLAAPLLLLFGAGDEFRNLSLAYAAFYAMCCFGIRRWYPRPVAGLPDEAPCPHAR